MTNINGQTIAFEEFDVDAHALAPEYFDDRMHHFEEMYHKTFPGGWGEFFDAYSNGHTEKGNLDFDEWAFLCEHFLRKLTRAWQPPGVCVDFLEKPETVSGFSIVGGTSCLMRLDTLLLWTEKSGTALTGRRLMGHS